MLSDPSLFRVSYSAGESDLLIAGVCSSEELAVEGAVA